MKQQTLAQELGQLWANPRDDEPIDVVIVGSGYGGSVAAAGLAGLVRGDPSAGPARPLRVVVLERGRHWRPGEFPSRLADLPGHVRLVKQATGEVAGNPEGLFDIRMGDDVMALLGNGLGGGSLINAGVLLEPDVRDFADPRWAHWRALLATLYTRCYFERALRELGGVRERNGLRIENTIARHHDTRAGHTLAKTDALAALQAAAGGADASPPGAHRLPPISVAMKDGPNQASVMLKACTLCGDCLTGCNVGAKNSLDVNLLVEARRAEAEIYTGASVVSLKHEAGAPGGTQWVLRVAHSDPDLQAREKGLLYLRARNVILAAGSLGSTEILLRSRDDRLRFSPRLGEGFSCNGDNIAAVYRMPKAAHGSADEDIPGEQRRVGPTITSTFTLERDRPRSPQVQEFAVPAPLKRVLDEVVTTAHALYALPEADWSRHGAEPVGTIDPLAVNDAHIEHTLLVGLIGHDDAAGSLRLPQPVRPREGPPTPGTLCIHWPGARHALALSAPHERLEKIARGLNPAHTRLIANPVWRLLPPGMERMVSQPRGPVLTVHPLGGCGIGATVDEGVVDGCGRVFDAAGAGWHGSLLVLDGAILPGSLGVNPALTITALALHAVDQLRQRWGLHASAVAPPPPPPRAPRPQVVPPAQAPAAAPATTEVEIIERLSGAAWLALDGLQTRKCWVELTLAYKAVPLRALSKMLARRLEVDEGHDKTRLRIYDHAQWEKERLRVLGDEQRRPHLLVEAHLSGELRFLHREPSRGWGRALRGAVAWLVNRGLRDTYQDAITPDPQNRGLLRKLAKLGRGLVGLVKQATHAGEVRRFDYALTIGAAVDGGRLALAGEIRGCKRLTYGLRANPWQQLTRLQLESMPGLQGSAVLQLDTGFMAGIGVVLLSLCRQRDHASALADLASFGLQLTRVLLYTHLWTFRKPDADGQRPPRRLPGKVGEVEPQVTELVVDRIRGSDTPVKIRLTRYPQAAGRSGPPLLMVHGYSASGTTFTHATLKPSAAEYFHRRGRDVWVIDLRTSAGMPTARHPWSFEDAALVDLPAALLHIKSVTGQPVDVLAHCIGATMLAMAILGDASEVRSNEQQLGPDTWLTREQLGQLAAFNGMPAAGRPHPCIRSVVLAQKGPLLRYSDDNVLRAYLLGSVRRLVFSDDYQFRPPSEPSVSDELFDRVLASLPYPKADYDIENPRWDPSATTAWTATRHRMDALYGRVFSAANLRPPTLDAIDDLFGPLNLDTISQTAHFARFSAITNQAGRGEFVSRGRLHERWSGIPTLALHAADNGITDPHTLRLLGDHLKEAGVPIECKAYPGMGHQDTLIGTGAELVFADIEQFLRHAQPPAAVPVLSVGWFIEPPWVGPRIQVDAPGQRPQVVAMPRPDQGRPELFLLPGRRDANGCCEPYVQAAPVARSNTTGASGEWLFATAPAWQPPPARGTKYGWFAVLIYDLDETSGAAQPASIIADTMRADAQSAARPAAAAMLAQPSFAGNGGARSPRRRCAARAPAPKLPPAWALGNAMLTRAAEWLYGAGEQELADCFVALDDLQRAERQRRAQPPQTPFAFTVASCQYPYGLIDGPIASAGLRAMCHGLDDTGLALLLGDQIYADATAGLLDATRRDERYDQPYDRALRVPALRELVRRVPVEILPDDHELIDNWEPFAPRVRDAWLRAERARRDARTLGLAAFYKYQRPAPPPPQRPEPLASRRAGFRRDAEVPPAADRQFSHAGYPFFLLDTRTRRSARGSTLAADEANIIDAEQWRDLKAWLRQHAAEVKFVATASLLLPRRRENAAQSIASERSDTWDGFPNSLDRLLAFLVTNNIRRTVFLSGDEHHSLIAEATLNNRIKLVSIHASALYAPYPFANGRPQDFVETDNFTVAGGAYPVRVDTQFAPPGDGYTRIDVLPGARLRVSFQKAAGNAPGVEVGLD